MLRWKGLLRCLTERMTTAKTRHKVDAALKAKNAPEAVREKATMADLAQCYAVQPNQIHASCSQQWRADRGSVRMIVMSGQCPTNRFRQSSSAGPFQLPEMSTFCCLPASGPNASTRTGCVALSCERRMDLLDQRVGHFHAPRFSN